MTHNFKSRDASASKKHPVSKESVIQGVREKVTFTMMLKLKYPSVQVWLRGAPSTIGKNVKVSTDRKLSQRNSRKAKKTKLPQNSMKYHQKECLTTP